MKLVRWLFVLVLALPPATAEAEPAVARHTGLARLAVANPLSGAPIQTLVWYPTSAAPSVVKMGPLEVEVALNGAPEQGAYPLVVISHGTGGSNLDHRDTAIHLAQRGFVVVTPTHTGDNFQDSSGYGKDVQLVGRPRHVKAVIDALLAHAVFGKLVDATRIGIIGMSAGGYTALVLAGGKPDFGRFVNYCREQPDDASICKTGRKITAAPLVADWSLVQDARITSMVLMAPALDFAFDRESVAGVQLPIKLYRPQADEVLRYPNNPEHLRQMLPREPEYVVLPGAGHYVFLAPCSPALAQQARAICSDPPGVDRAAVHARLNAEIEEWFRRTLN